jgi:hypothetical protein
MAAHPTQNTALGVANARHGPSHGCALRLDGGALAGLLGHARFIHTF